MLCFAFCFHFSNVLLNFAVKVCQHYSDGESVKIPNGQDCTSFYICKKHVPILTPCLSETILNYQGSKRTKCIPSEDPNKCPQKDDPSFLDNALKELSSRNKKS